MRTAEEARLDESRAADAFWMRGLVPSSWVACTPPPAQAPVHRAGDMHPRPGSAYYLDGSGGERTSDPRLRRCGWAAVHMCHGQVIGSLHGILPGPFQTVPRSELLALVALVEEIGPQLAATAAPLASDCAYVVNGVTRRPTATPV